MKNEKLLSIIIPSYNMEHFLPRGLDSLLVRDEKLRDELDVIVVNDGSKDRTSEIAHSYASRYPSVFRVIDKQNGNYGSCINAALKDLRGEFVKVLDADDCYEMDGLEKLLRFLAQTDADVILTDWIDIAGDGHVIGRRTWNGPKETTINIDVFLQKNVTALMFGLTYRSDLFKRMDYHQLEGVSYTDLEWSNLPLAVASSVAYLPVVVYRYTTERDGQTSGVKTKRRNYWMILKMFLDLVRQYEQMRPVLKGVHLALMDKRLASKVESFYRLGCVLGAKVDFKQFDRNLASLSPEIYRQAETFSRGRLHFNFVSNFRNESILARVKIACYCKLVRFKNICRM